MIFAVTPTVGWALPLVWPAVMSAAGALGYKVFTASADESILKNRLTQEMENLQIVTVPLESTIKDVVSDEIGREQIVRFVRDGLTIVFKRDVRGKFRVDIMGPKAMPKFELELIGKEFLQEVVQQFAYNKMSKEMQHRGATVVSEQVAENGDIVLKLRRWE